MDASRFARPHVLPTFAISAYCPPPTAYSLVAALRQVDVVELQRLLDQLRVARVAGVHPGRHVGEVLVVAERLAVLGLALLAEVAAARLGAVEGVQADQLPQL